MRLLEGGCSAPVAAHAEVLSGWSNCILRQMLDHSSIWIIVYEASYRMFKLRRDDLIGIYEICSVEGDHTTVQNGIPPTTK